MNEHAPQPTNEQPDMAKFSARDVFLDTVQEVQSYGPLEKSDVKAFANELGIEDDYSKWHATVPGLKVLDREKLQSEIDSRETDPTAEEAVNIQHDQRQAEYDELFAGKTDEDIEKEISRNSHEKRVLEHNEAYQLENQARGERNIAKAAEIEKIKLHNEKVAKNNELADKYMDRYDDIVGTTNLNSLSYTELGRLLGEKTSYKIPKDEYVERLKTLQGTLRRQGKLAHMDPKEIPNAFADTNTPAITTNESTLATIDAMKSFNKNMLRAQLEKSDAVQEQPEGMNEKAINLAEQYANTPEADKEAFLKAHADEYLSQLIGLVNDIKANKVPLSGMSPREIEGVMQPLYDYMMNHYEGVDGERFTEEEARNFLGGIYKQNVTPLFENATPAVSTPEADVPPVDVLALSNEYAKFKTPEERISFLDENTESIHALIRDMMLAQDNGETPLADMPRAEAQQIFKLVGGYLRLNNEADTESLVNFWHKLNGTKPAEVKTAPEAAKEQTVNAAAAKVGKTATGRIWSSSKDPIWNTSFKELKASYKDGQQANETGKIGKLFNRAGRTKTAGKINNVYQNMKARRGKTAPMAGVSFGVAGLGAMSQAEANGMAQRADVQKPTNGAQDKASDPSLKVMAHGRRS